LKLLFSTLALSFLTGLTANGASITYDFEDLALGTLGPFTDSKGGVVAMFSSPTDPGFGVAQNSGEFAPPFMGKFITNGTGFPIDISFSESLQAASLDFATDNLSGVSTLVTVKAYRGGPNGLLLATLGTLGVIPPGSEFPQGVATISAPGFDTLVISGAQPGLAVDNLTVSTVPEPGSLGMFVLLSGLVCWSKTRKSLLRTTE
jgi:hypothetical protein